MQVPGIARKWATFGCQECDHVFAWHIPPLFQPMPQCECGGHTRLLSILYSREERLRGIDDDWRESRTQPEAA